jgi:hypothetical protein
MVPVKNKLTNRTDGRHAGVAASFAEKKLFTGRTNAVTINKKPSTASNPRRAAPDSEIAL